MEALHSNPALLRPPLLSSPTSPLPLTNLPYPNNNFRSRAVAKHAALAELVRLKESSTRFRQSKSYLPGQVAIVAEDPEPGDFLKASLEKGPLAQPRSSAAKIARSDRQKDAATRVHHSKSYLERQAAVAEVQESTDLVTSLERFNKLLKVQDLNAILRNFGKLNKLQDLRKLFEWMQLHGKISPSTYSSYIKFIQEASHALEIYDAIIDQSMKSNVFICNAVLSCVVRNGKSDSSMRLFYQMKQDGLMPDIVTYSTLLAGCMKGDDGYPKALKLVRELEQSDLKMDSIMYGTLLAVCASNNRCEEAEIYFQKMKDEGITPNEFHYSSMLNAYSIDGDYKKADGLMKYMETAGLAPNKVVFSSFCEKTLRALYSCRMVILTTLLKVYVRGGFFKKSRALLAELESMGYAHDEMPYCLLMDGFAKAGRIDDAKLIFDEMMGKSVKSDGYAHSIMISAFCRGKLLEDAKMLATDLETKQESYDLVMSNTMLCAYCRAGEMDKVMETLKKMDEFGIQPDFNTFHILIKYFCKERLYLLAYKTVEDMHKNGHRPEEELCSSLIYHLDKMKAHSQAYSVYTMLKYSKRNICKALHEKVLHILIAGRLLKEAYVVVKDNSDTISKPTIRKFTAVFMKSGNVNLINDVLKCVHASGNKLNQEIFQLAVSRFIIMPDKKDLLLQLLQWMPGQGYAVDSSTRELILRSSHFFGHDVIDEILSKHRALSRQLKSSDRKR